MLVEPDEPDSAAPPIATATASTKTLPYREGMLNLLTVMLFNFRARCPISESRGRVQWYTNPLPQRTEAIDRIYMGLSPLQGVRAPS